MYVDLLTHPRFQTIYEQKNSEDEDSSDPGIELMVQTRTGPIKVAMPRAQTNTSINASVHASVNPSVHASAPVTLPRTALSASSSVQEADHIKEAEEILALFALSKRNQQQEAPDRKQYPRACYSSTPQSFCRDHQLSHLTTFTNFELSLERADDKYPDEFYNEAIGLGTYCEHYKLFDKAAEELFHFFCCVQERNTSNPTLAYTEESSQEAPLYRNLVPHVKPEAQGNLVGKLAIIGLKNNIVFSSIYSITASCQYTIKYLPHQFEVILNAARAMIEQECASKIAASVVSEAEARQQAHVVQTELASNTQAFLAIRDNSLRYFQFAYGCHRDFLNQHKITPENPDLLIPISASRAKEIQHSVVAYLHVLHAHPYRGGCLGSNPDATIERFEATFPILLEKTLAILRSTLTRSVTEHQYQHQQDESLPTYPHLLFARNINFPFVEVKKELRDLVTMLEPPKDGSGNKQTLSMVLDGIFLALSGHEIAAYYPQFGPTRSSNSKKRILA